MTYAIVGFLLMYPILILRDWLDLICQWKDVFGFFSADADWPARYADWRLLRIRRDFLFQEWFAATAALSCLEAICETG